MDSDSAVLANDSGHLLNRTPLHPALVSLIALHNHTVPEEGLTWPVKSHHGSGSGDKQRSPSPCMMVGWNIVRAPWMRGREVMLSGSQALQGTLGAMQTPFGAGLTHQKLSVLAAGGL